MVDRRGAHESDVVVFQKIYDAKAIELAQSLRARGIKTVFDLCDNHFYNPDGLPKLTERAARLRRMIDIVDVVSISTEPLRQLVADKQTVLIDDALDEFDPPASSGLLARLIRARPRGRAGLRLVWYGNAGLESPSFGLAHLPKVIPVLEALNREMPIHLRVISNSKSAYRKFVAGAAFSTEYRQWSAATFPALFRGHDVCIVPIDVNPFTVCKTGNRLALSLRLGVPVVADRIPSFEEFSRFVLLGSWDESLRRYAADPALRARHAAEGCAHVEARYAPQRILAQWAALFGKLTATGARAAS